jgi:hypothetical protein
LEPNVELVKVCEICGTMASIMDTRCPRCHEYGTLRERLQCARCQRLLDGPSCRACGQASPITAATPAPAPDAFVTDELGQAPRSNLVDPHAVHPALAAGVGGAVFGAVAGVAAAYFFLGEHPFDLALLGGLGLVIGAVLGALLGGNVSQTPH